MRIQARYAQLFKPEEKTEVIGRIQAAADRNIRRFGLAPLGTERAEVAVPGKE
jgi:pyruvate ferredoxin oxidoreductase beta subunit